MRYREVASRTFCRSSSENVANECALSPVVLTSVTTNGGKTATATLNSIAPLPTFAAPTLALDFLGGGTIALTVPAGMTEAYLIVVDTTGGCYGLVAPTYFTTKTSTTVP